MPEITIFHGTDHIINKPQPALCNERNDYGKGFYCSETAEMAKEWACKENKDGFVNVYSLNTDGLKILNLLDGSHSVLNWIALLLKNRTFSLQEEIAIDAKEYVISHYSIDTTEYDVIIGYRADNSYFSYAQSFVGNALPLRSLDKALRNGKLGTQIVLVSEKAFDQLEFVSAEPAEREIYYPKFVTRDITARQKYKDESKRSRTYLYDIFVIDMLRGEIENDDPRIQRIVSE